MKYLLDTHAALWLFEGNEKLSQAAKEIFSTRKTKYIYKRSFSLGSCG